MRIPEAVLQSISEKLDIGQVVGDYVSLKRQGGRLWGLCPFHSERTASFSVTPDRGMFYCFGCGKGGSIFQFVMEVDRLTFVEAVKALADRAGVTLPATAGEEREESRRAALGELYDRVAGSFHYLLMERPDAAAARAYLEERGFSRETLGSFRIGYAPSERGWLYDFLQKKGYSGEFLDSSGLFSSRTARSALFSNRIMFPITDRHGKTIAFGARAMDDATPKYLNSPETELFHKSDNLFGLDRALSTIRERGEFLLVEGYTDVLALHQAGLTNAVAPLGTSFTELQARKLRRYVERGLLSFDGDEAGIAAGAKAIELCERVGILPAVVRLPAGRDPADILETGGPDALHKFTKYPINAFEFLLESALARRDVQKPEGKAAVLGDLKGYLEAIDSDIRRETCFERLAEALVVDRAAVNREFARLTSTGGRMVPAPASEPEASLSAELYLMLAVTANRRYFTYVRSRLSTEDLEDTLARSLYVALEECFRNEDETIAGLIGAIEESNLSKLVLERLSDDLFSQNVDDLIKQSLATVRRRSFERKRASIQGQLRTAQREGRDYEELKGLVAEKAFLDSEIENL